MHSPISEIEFPQNLTTERLTLKRICHRREEWDEHYIPTDILRGIQQSVPELKQRFSWMYPDVPQSFEMSKTYWDMAGLATQNHSFHFAVYCGNEFIGFVSLDGREPALPSFSIGYWCVTPHAGKGYIFEAVSEVIRFAIENVKAKRLDITPAVDNAPSRAICEKLVQKFNFEYVGVKKNAWRHLVTNTLCDCAIYVFSQPD